MAAWQAGNEDDEGLTTWELGEKTGRSEDWVNKRLMVLHRRGQLVVGKRNGQDRTGRPHTYPVYRLK